MCTGHRAEPGQRADPRQERVRPSAHGHERPDTVDSRTKRVTLHRRRSPGRRLITGQGIGFLRKNRKDGVVQPGLPHEFELALEIGVQTDEAEATLLPVVNELIGDPRAIRPATPRRPAGSESAKSRCRWQRDFHRIVQQAALPSLRLGYIVLPESLADYFVAYRRRTDFRSMGLDQVVLCDFIVHGHLGRHLRRMRDLYASRLAALIDSGHRYLDGLLTIPNVRAGLYTVGFLENGMTSRQAESPRPHTASRQGRWTASRRNAPTHGACYSALGRSTRRQFETAWPRSPERSTDE